MTERPASPQTRGWIRWLPKAAFECAVVVFGVVLGLAVNDWREARQTRARVVEMHAEFAAEIRANRDELASDAYGPHHKRLALAWTKLASLPAPTSADRDAAWTAASTGMHPFRPRDAVWTAFAHGALIEQLPPREVLQLAEIYRAQDELRETNRTLYATVTIASEAAETPAFIRSQANVIRMTLNDIVAAETRLLERYERALK